VNPDDLLLHVDPLERLLQRRSAKRGRRGLVGVNYLHKIRMAMPAAVYGAMLAGVDVVLGRQHRNHH